jgi:cation diffusion facilitator CzcD-associated flavoprotein CzcO
MRRELTIGGGFGGMAAAQRLKTADLDVAATAEGV